MVFLYVYYTYTLMDIKDNSYYSLPTKSLIAFYVVCAVFLGNAFSA